MKYNTPFFQDKRGGISTIAVLIGMVVVGIGILVGSQIRNQNINIQPRATASADPLWTNIKPGGTDANPIYPWTNRGPTSGWESYISKQVNICNGESCWTLDRSTNPPTVLNNGSPRILSKDPNFNTTKADPNGNFMWSQGGPTAAWTVVSQSNGQTVNETAVCNKNYCWRYLRYPDGVAGSGWRDGGAPIYLPTANDVWKDTRVASLFAGNGITVAWSDPVNNNLTLCNGSDCRSLNFKTWTWNYNGAKISPFPSGVSQFTSAWTSPATNIISLCLANLCNLYDIGKASYTGQTLIDAPSTSVPVDSCNSNADCMTCGSTCVNKTAELACAAVVADFTCSCVSNKCVVNSNTQVQIGIIEVDSNTNYNLPKVAAYKLNTNEKIADCTTSTTQPGRTRGYSCSGLTSGTSYTYKAVYAPKNTTRPTITVQINGNAGANVLHDMYVTFLNTLTLNPATPTTSSSTQATITVKKLQSPVALMQVGAGSNGVSWLADSTEITTSTFTKNLTAPPVAAGTYKISVSVAEGYKAQKPGSILTYDYNITVIQPCTPTLTGPANNATVSSNPTFTFSGCSGRNRIEVKEGTSLIDSVITDKTSYQFGSPKWANGKTYSWTVKNCTNADCVGGTPSAARTFKYQTTTSTNTLGTPAITAPTQAQNFNTGNITLKWNAGANATSYDWLIMRDGRSGNYKSGNVTGTSVNVTALPPGEYRAQVIAKNTTGTKASSYVEFNIYFNKISPLNNAEVKFGTTQSFEWTPSLQYDVNSTYFIIYGPGGEKDIVFYKQLQSSSSEYLAGKVSVPITTATSSKFAIGTTYTWQIIHSGAGTAQENVPKADPATSAPQSFKVVKELTNTCPKKAQGDANCDNMINYIDFVCWRGELNNQKPANCTSADFNSSGGKPNATDYGIWRKTFLDPLNTQ